MAVRLDLLYFRAYGKPTIVDWKVYEPNSTGDAHLQTSLYAWALCRNSNWSVQSPRDVELLEVRLLDRLVIRHRCTEEVFQELEDRIFRSVEEIRALFGDGAFDDQLLQDCEYANSPNTCCYCPYRTLCEGAETCRRIF